VKITVTESGSTVRIELDNEPFNLKGLGNGNGNGAPITWSIDNTSTSGWAFTASGGISIQDAGGNFIDGVQTGNNASYACKRKVADGKSYKYAISVSKKADGQETRTIIIDPTIINEP